MYLKLIENANKFTRLILHLDSRIYFNHIRKNSAIWIYMFMKY